MASSAPHTPPLLRRLESIFSLAGDERKALADLPMQVVALGPNQDITREGDRPAQCSLMLEGLACTYKLSGEGKRQIMAFHIAGDLPDLQSLHLDVLDNSLATLSACTVGFIAHEALHDLFSRFPRIAAALWRATLIDAAIFREWIMNLGRRDAASRLAHLLCEQVARAPAVGLTQDHTCDLPLTQGVLADAMGISAVHVNRVLQQLRGAGLIRWNGAVLSVLDWEALARLADFDPAYLHLKRKQAVA